MPGTFTPYSLNLQKQSYFHRFKSELCPLDFELTKSLSNTYEISNSNT